MAISGKNTRVLLNGATLGGINEASITLNGETIDVTTFLSGGFVKKSRGLTSADLSLSGFTIPSDTEQIELITAFLAGDDVTLQVLFDGTVGYEGDFLSSSIDQGSTVSGEVTFSVSLESNGAITVI